MASNYHVIPTFSFAPRHHHHMYRQPRDVHPFHLFDLMDKVFEPAEALAGEGMLLPAGGRRGFGQVHFGEDPSKFEVMFDLGHEFKDDDVDINVKLLDDEMLSIEARHETGSVESGEYRNHYFSKTVSIPEGTDVEGLKSSLSNNGVLKIEAPRKAIEEPKPSIREIKIERIAKPAVEAGASGAEGGVAGAEGAKGAAKQ